MQIKYLTLAMTAALALNLTACGSSSDDDTKKTDKPKTEKPKTEKPKTEKPKTEKPKTEKPKTEKPKSEADKTDVKGQVKDDKTNPGDAAYSGDEAKSASTVGQQYRRGVKSDFDRDLNPDKSGNTSIRSYKTIQNKGLTNIILGRESIELKEEEVIVRRYAGQNETDPDWDNYYSLQAWNESTDRANLLANHPNNPAAPGYRPEQEAVDPSNVDITGDFRFHTTYTENGVTKNIRTRLRDNGLVGMVSNATALGGYYIVGQEDQEYVLNSDNRTIKGFLVQGQNSPTRIFGHFYNGTEGIVNPVTGQLITPAKKEANSWMHSENKKGYIWSVADGRYVGYEKVPNVSNLPAGKDQMDYESANVVYNRSAHTPALAADAIKLRYVQYGRVTNNIDPIPKGSAVSGQKFIYSPYQGKHIYKLGDDVTNVNDTVDTYFYRGLGETTLDQMKALKSDAVYKYSGHAVTYGIDNRYHGGGNGGADTNSFTGTKNLAGLGNFVSATFDNAKKTVKGEIYNVWLTNASRSNKTVKDTLVNFSGKVVGNSVDGTSNVAYNSKAATGTFRGSFYGSGANELGGTVNSVESGYGKAAWGGVFGAKRVSKSGNAAQVD